VQAGGGGVMKAKGGQTQYSGVPNNPLGECMLTLFHLGRVTPPV